MNGGNDMPVGDCQRAFVEAAAKDGLSLGPSSVRWINRRGHLGLPAECGDVGALLEAIFVELGGDSEAQSRKRATPLTGDFVELGTGTLIEIDEAQHFTSFRATTLERYPAEVPLGFDRHDYLALCHELTPRSDRYRAEKEAVGFGPGGRQRQRAYHDALRDLAAPACGRPPVIRVAVLDGDGAGAYWNERERLRHLLMDAGAAPFATPYEERPRDLEGAVEELRAVLSSLEQVVPAARDKRFFVEACEELGVTARAIVAAFDREQRLHERGGA